jgi:ABC-type branched-subunit amino acid transport system ATPase component
VSEGLATEPKILPLDEVAAEPTPTEVDELIRLLKGVNERGRAVLLDEIKSLEG